MGEKALTVREMRAAQEPSSTDLLLIACELASRVECMPQRENGADAAVYESSGATVARRIRAGANVETSCSAAPVDSGPHPARFYWTVGMRVGAARRTNYKIWLDAAPAELIAMWLAREEARALRDSLPHAQRKKKPWGLL